MTAHPIDDPDAPVGVLASVRSHRRSRDEAERQLLRDAVAWAVMHNVDSIDEAATITLPGVGDTGVTVAGEGAPLIAEFAVAEFASALGMSTQAGLHFLGHAIELRYRLPRLWSGVMSQRVPAWQARRIADSTGHLSRDAAAYVDAHAAAVAGRVGPAQLSRLVDEALARFMPETAEQLARQSWDGRHVTIDHNQVSFTGTTRIEAEIDLVDAIAFDTAVAAGAAKLAALGSVDTLDGRRATAVGDLARSQLALDLGTDPESTNPTATTRSRPRRSHEVVLYLHLSESAITAGRDGLEVGRIDNVRRPVLAEQIRAWCAAPDANLVIKPVIDLAGHVRVDQWEVPDRIAEAVILRDGSCVFPWCTRPARSCRLQGEPAHGCDLDHRQPHARGGPTCSCNLAPLCRRHHRLKTHGGWSYTSPEPGCYLWVSPFGYHYRRDHLGTLDLSRDPRLARDAEDLDTLSNHDHPEPDS